jgi:hypothetical protein
MTMKRIVLAMICVLSLALGRLDMNMPVPLEESLKITAKVMNEALPAMVDAEIRHDKVEVDRLNLTLKFTLVNFTKAEMNAERLKSIVEIDIREQVCTDKETQIILKQGMTMVYDYVDKNKKHITQFVYDAKVCDLLTNIDQIKQTIMSIPTSEELTII